MAHASSSSKTAEPRPRRCACCWRSSGYEVPWPPMARPRSSSSASGSFDLVISDITMPGISGYEVCRQIKSQSSAAETSRCCC